MSQSHAIAQNEKVFPVLAQRLATQNPNDYVVTVQKLKAWLSSDRAYYPIARGKIIELLEIAVTGYTDVMRYQQGGVHTAHALRELVGTVVPHIHRFEEASLRARVLRVVEITENLLRNVYLNEVVGSTVQGIPFRERPVKINLPSADNNILAGNDVGLGSPALQIPTISAIGSPEIDVKPVVTSSHTDSQVKSEPEDPPLPWGPVGFTSIYTVGGKRMTETVLAPNSKQSLPMDVNQDNSVGPSSAVPPPAPTKPQPKRVRKPEMSKLLARDLDWCKLAMAGAAQVQLPQTPASSVEPAPTPMDIDVAPFAPREQDVQAISVKQEVLPGMDREEGVSSSPRHDGVTTTETVMGDSSLPQPPPQLEPATAPASTPAAPASILPAPVPSPASTPAAPASTLPAPVPSPASTPAVPASTLPAPAPPALAPAPASGSFHIPSDDNGVSTRATAERSPSLPPPPPVHSLQDIPSAEFRNRSLPPSAATDGESPKTSPAILPPPPNTVHDISYMPSKDTTVPPTAANSGSSLPPPTTGSQPLSGQSPAKIENSASSPGSGNDLLPPLFEPLQHAVDDVHPSTLPSQAEQSVRPEESPLNGDLAQEAFHHERVIMHFTKGDTLPRAHHVNLTVSEDMHSNVSRWVKRRVSPTDVPSSFCISVACYRLCDLGTAAESSPNDENLSMTEATAHAPCSWPTSTHLLLSLKYGEKNWSLPLSPPLKVTPDQFMDISSFVQAGENTLQIIQYGDLSDHVLVIHAHHPTGAQLAELGKMQAADQKWKSFLDSICGPIELGPSRENAQESPVR